MGVATGSIAIEVRKQKKIPITQAFFPEKNDDSDSQADKDASICDVRLPSYWSASNMSSLALYLEHSFRGVLLCSQPSTSC